MTIRYLFPVLVILLASCQKSQDNNSILKFYGDASEDIGYSVAKADNGYVIGGQFTKVARTNGNIIDDKNSIKKLEIIKVGNDGNTIWKNSYGDRQPAVGSKILTLDDGSIICTGYVIDTLNLTKDIFVVWTNADGTSSIQNIFKSDGNQYGVDIIKTDEGFLILGTTDVERVGATDSTGNAAGKNDILLLRIKDNLEQISTPVSIGFPGNDEGVAIKTDINGGYIIAGTTDRSWPGQAQNNIFLLRITSELVSNGFTIIGGTPDEYAGDIEVLNDGYLVAGTIGSAGTDQKGHVWKMSATIFDAPITSNAPISSHDIVLDQSSSTQSSFSINAISRYKTNSFVMAGQTGTGTSARMLIFVTDADGNIVEGKKLITGGTGIQAAYDVISDTDGSIIAVGKNNYEDNTMISLLKFRF
jgi:hypothetical protein